MGGSATVTNMLPKKPLARRMHCNVAGRQPEHHRPTAYGDQMKIETPVTLIFYPRTNPKTKYRIKWFAAFGWVLINQYTGFPIGVGPKLDPIMNVMRSRGAIEHARRLSYHPVNSPERAAYSKHDRF